MKNVVLLISLFILTAFGCGGSSSSGGGSKPQANFQMIAIDKTMQSYGSPSLTITIKNVGSATGYNVGCNSYARNASNTIIDTAKTFYAGLGNIAVNDTAQDVGVFFNLKSHDDYKTLTHECSWLTR
jgi:hypothetical protein